MNIIPPEVMVSVVLGILAASGGLVEVGRRLGRGEANQDNTETEIDDLDNKLETKFNTLEERMRRNEQIRAKEREVMIEWLSRIHDALPDSAGDVKRPEEIQRNLDVDTDLGVRDDD